MEIEETIINNLVKYYTDANNKRIHLDDINKEIININPNRNNSICLWNAINSIIKINNKCNHLLIYDCDNITLHIPNFISGITCIKSNNCNLLFNDCMITNIEISESFDINIRSISFNTNLLYKSITSNIIKNINYKTINHIKINDGLISNWTVKNLNL